MRRVALAALCLSLAAASHAADAETVYDRATTVALAGAVPAGVIGMAGMAGAAGLVLAPTGSELGENAQGVVAGAALLSPVAALGTGLLAGGSLAARRALEEQGLSVRRAGGVAAWGLLGGGALALGAAVALDAEEAGALAGALVLGAQGAGAWQLAANHRAHQTLDLGWEDRYDQGAAAFVGGVSAVGVGALSAAGGVTLVWVYQRAVDRSSGLRRLVTVIGMAPVLAVGVVSLAAAVPLVGVGSGLMTAGSLGAWRALGEGGPSGALGVASAVTLAVVPGLGVAAGLTDDSTLAWVGGGLWVASLGLAAGQMALDGAARGQVATTAVLRLPPVVVRF
ncbi:MAG: hypothetical protein JXX28_12965 [Deltaproteobacteria bacterium]|nr:hypothetical protein [Deltaproteobacteria bacterium]